MPCLEITLPSTSIHVKQELCAQLTTVVERVAGFEPEIFRMHFTEYAPGEAGTGGVLWDGINGVPYVHFVLSCPRLKRTVKRDLCNAFSAKFTEILQRPDWLPVIHICEHPYDNIFGSGTWLAERPELAERKFYYELPKD